MGKMKAIKCFITSKSVIINNVTMAIDPPLSIEEFADDMTMLRRRSEELDEHWLREFGGKLFRRVFAGAALDQYQLTDPVAIAFVVSDELAHLPWELLHDRSNWVARTRGIVRIATTGRSAPVVIPKPGILRILAGIAGPLFDEGRPDDEIPPIDVDSHAGILQKLEGEPFPAEIKIRKHITREILAQEASENYHVLHFVGHGDIGRLAFETRHATLDLAEERWIREQITVAVRGNLRLVVINSCHSADAGEEVAGVAKTILEAGVPAVIAMQGSISELADLAFMKNLYSSLARGKSIDEAVMDARRAMATDWQIEAHEWATPILFINDSLLEQEAALNLMDAEMMPDSGVKIVFPPQAPQDPMMTREQKFVGRRRELSDVLRSLDPDRRDGAQIVCLHGEGGTGKTAIAIESACRMAEWFSEIIWLSCRGAPPEELKEHVKGDDPLSRISGAEGFLASLAYKCGFEPNGIKRPIYPEEGDETPAQMRDGILRSLRGNRWKLLVLDGMEELAGSDVVRSLLVNMPPNCKVLITSRDSLEINERQIHVGMMKKPDSLRLLAAYGALKGLQADSEEMSEIVHFTGGHPMAMRLVVSQVTSAERTLTSVLKDLRKAKGTIFDYIFSRSLELALRDGRKIFAAMALFYPTASRKALQEVCGLNEEAFGKAIKRVVGLSLVESYQQGKRFGLHQLARAKAEQQLAGDQDNEKYRERTAKFFTEFVNATAPMTQPATATQALEAQMPAGTPRQQIQDAAMQLIVKPALEMVETELINCLSVLDWVLGKSNLDMATDLLRGLSGFLTTRGHWGEAAHYCKKIADGWRNQGNYHAEAVALRNLAMMYDRQGKWDEAIECYEGVLKVARESQDKVLEAHTLEGIGTVYGEQKKWDEAVRYLETSREIFYRLGNRIEEAGALNNLGIVYRQTGRWEEAVQSFVSCREIFKQFNEKYGEADVLGNLGEYYQTVQQYEDAAKYYEQSLKIFEDLGDKEGQGNVLNSLGTLCQDHGDLDRAMQYYQDSLNLKHEIGDLNGQRVIWNGIATVYSMQNQWSKAANACIESFQIAIQIHSSAVIDSLRSVLDVSKSMLKSREFATPAQLAYRLSQLVQGLEIPDDDIRAVLAISHGVFTIIGLVAACEWDKTSDIYKEAMELARSLDERTEAALKLVDWLEKDADRGV